LPDQDACHKSAEDRLNANQASGEGERAHDHDDHRYDRRFTARIVVGPLDELEDDATAERQAKRQKKHGAKDAQACGDPIDAGLRRQAKRERDDNPANGVVDHRRGENDLPDVASGKAHVVHDSCDDLHRRDRQRRADE
jgi:hypothetical protein